MQNKAQDDDLVMNLVEMALARVPGRARVLSARTPATTTRNCSKKSGSTSSGKSA